MFVHVYNEVFLDGLSVYLFIAVFIGKTYSEGKVCLFLMVNHSSFKLLASFSTPSIKFSVINRRCPVCKQVHGVCGNQKIQVGIICFIIAA